VKKLQLEAPEIRRNPLRNITILVTRPKDQAGEFAGILQSAGATVIEFPSIRVIDPPDWNNYETAIRQINDFKIIVFTSVNAVQYFLKKFPAEDLHALHSKKIYAVGVKTMQAAHRLGLRAETISSGFNGRNLGRSLILTHGEKSKILYPHGNKGKHELSSILREHGFDVTEIEVYQNTGPDKADVEKFKSALKKIKIDVITFFSPSSIESLLEIVPVEIAGASVIATIGPTTANAARQNGLLVHITATRPTSENLAREIVSYFNQTDITKASDD
jgi:uroporphyrinogen III methyltransferase/synthase